MNNYKWYIINVFNGKEKSIKDRIKQKINDDQLEHFVEQIITPKEKYIQIRKGKKVQTERTYFPGYIFIECRMNKELISSINLVSGVITILGDSSRVPMSEREVSNMLTKVDDVQVKVEYDKLFSVDDKVKIVDGPFASMYGKIQKINMERKLVTVMVKIFSRETPVDLSFEQIVK